jgi:hypothetical protein
MAKRECQDPLLDEGRRRVGHAWLPTFPGPQDVGAEADQLPAPGVVRRWVDAHRPAGGAHVAEFSGERKGA